MSTYGNEQSSGDGKVPGQAGYAQAHEIAGARGKQERQGEGHGRSLADGAELMAKKHPGFKAVASGIAKKEGLPIKAADAILAKSSHGASGKAKKADPALRKVKGK